MNGTRQQVRNCCNSGRKSRRQNTFGNAVNISEADVKTCRKVAVIFVRNIFT